MKIITLPVGFLRTNCYIVYNEETLEAFIVDPGDSSVRIIEKICELGVNVTHIFLTHSHFDHIMALAAVREATNAIIGIHESEAAFLENYDERVISALRLPKLSIKPARADLKLRDGDVIECIGERFTVVHTPGHTTGSLCLDNGTVLFTGDTLFQNGCGRCDLPGGSIKEMYASLLRLCRLDGNREVYPGHGSATNLEAERLNNINILHAEDKR